VSQVESAPPQGPEVTPPRPPSRPSRAALFIWVGIAAFCLLMFGSALGLFIWSHTAFDSKDLKKAKSVKITYHLRNNVIKSVVVDDPAKLAELLDSLEIVRADMGGPSFWSQRQAAVDFTLPGGKGARVTFQSPTQLDRANWGPVYVTPAFHRKVNEILSAAEKRPIDIMKDN
jgi:hypothetical protein